MAKRSLILLLVTVLYLALTSIADTGIIFQPEGDENDRHTYLVKENNKLTISCIHNSDDVRTIRWMNENDEAVPKAKSLFTRNFKHESKLIFVNIQKHDTGKYSCSVVLDGGTIHSESIFINVISNVDWNTPKDVVGGVIGEELIIDCGAKGDPEPLIEIADENGQAVDENVYNVIDNKVTIEKLTKSHKDLSFKCIAIQKISVKDHYNATTTSEHKLTVDVYYPPEFESGGEEVEVFAAPYQNMTLMCLVVDSNPPVKIFEFYKGPQGLYSHERYAILPDILNNMSTLIISYVEDEDYGRYKCIANNGKLKSEQTFVLRKTKPPKQPFVDVEDINNTSVVLRVIDNREADSLPVLSHSFSFFPKENVSMAYSEEHGRKRQTSKKYVLLARNSNNLYEIKGLNKSVEYTFLVSSKNEVGEGDPAEVSVITGTNHYTSASSAFGLYVSLFAILNPISVIFWFLL